jgi:chromosome segregation ATPase
MALTEDDLKAMRLLMREEIHDAFEQRFEPFRRDVDERFREVDGRFEGLYAQNAKREQEYLCIKEQLTRQEQQLTEISKELGRHTQYFDDLDNRVTQLEKKIA